VPLSTIVLLLHAVAPDDRDDAVTPDRAYSWVGSLAHASVRRHIIGRSKRVHAFPLELSACGVLANEGRCRWMQAVAWYKKPGGGVLVYVKFYNGCMLGLFSVLRRASSCQ
jgi:hypothetical protein